MFGGGNKCATCNKSVYSNEQVSFEKKFYHTTCFKCSICDTIINSTSKAGSMDGVVSHRLCFEKQMKTTGGKYGGEKVIANASKLEPALAAKPAPPPPVAAAAAKPSAAERLAEPTSAARPAVAPKPAPVSMPKPAPAPAPKPSPAPAEKKQHEEKKVAVTPQELPLDEVNPTEEQLAHIRSVFQELDKDKTSFLTDLVGASKRAGWPVPEATAKKLLDGWSGKFNFDQFIAALLPVLRLEYRNWHWVAQLPVTVEDDKGPAIPGRWKTIRVFLSSTFVDMHGERDCLINEVFPEINNRVKSHYVRVVPVDLRWGVSSEETSSIQSTCLNEIDHCRTRSTCLPWFVGLRGRRLGWVQTKYQPPTDFENPDKLKWVPAFWRSETPQSITSMEVYHAFVGATAPTDDVVRSLFLFRKDEFAQDCPDNMRWLFDFEYLPREKEGKVDQDVQHQYAYVNDYARYLKDYETLQQQIKDSPHPKAVFEYPCNFKEAKLTGQLPWGKKFGVGSVGALDEFRDFITNTLTDSIKAEFPFPGELTAQERESAKHAALIEDRAEGFVGRKELLHRMLDYCQGRVTHKGSMLIVGEPGSGKSALMARFCEMYRALLQQQEEKSKTILISHLVGATEDSELVAKLLRRICEVIRDAASDEYFPSIPDDFETLKKETWTNYVENATKAGYRVVIVLDAVNQLRPLNNAHLMNWLPKELPNNCKIVISTLEFENNTYANLKQFQSHITEERVTPLDATDRQALVSALLAKYHKKLTCDNKDTFLGNQMEILLGKEQGTSPLYLVVACDVLRRFGVYEKLTEYLRSLPGTIPKLFEFVLADLEAQHGQALVRIVTSLLAVSRSGLSELEILAVLADPEVQNELGETRSNFSQLYGPLRNFFSSGGEGYIRFFHDQLLYVVRSRYGLQPLTRASNQAHGFLGKYFRGVVLEDLAGRTQATVGHSYAEIVYHLLNAKLDTELRQLFFTVDFLYRRIELFSVFALLDDLELYFTTNTNGSVKLLRAALQLAIPVLALGPSELLIQLYLRLAMDIHSHPDLKTMLDVASSAWSSSRAQHASGLLPVYDTGIVRPGTVISRFQGASSNMSLVAYLDDGRVLLTVQTSGEVGLWDLVSCKPLAALQGLNKVVGASLSPDKGTLLTVGRTTSELQVQMLLWDLRKPQPTSTPLVSKEIKQRAQGFSVNKEWTQVVTWYEDATVAFWDLSKPEAAPKVARHAGFYDNWQRKNAAEKVVDQRKADRKAARAKKQEARGGEAHSSDESQGDEDDGFEVEYQYSVKACTVFSKFAITMSDGDDGTLCVWDDKHKEPIATFQGGNSSDSMQGCQVLGDEAKNGPCLLIWTFDGFKTWNFNDLKGEVQSDLVKLTSIEKVIPNGKPNQLVVMTDDDMIVYEFGLPRVGSGDKITSTSVSEYHLPKVKGSSNNLEDVVLLKSGDLALLSCNGQVFIHDQDGKTNENQLVWAPNVDLAAEKKKESDSKGEYSLPQASAFTWNGERLLVRWDNGRMTLWHPTTKKSNYFFVDSNKSEGLEAIPAPDTAMLNRAVQWYSGTISYLDLTHEGITKASGDELAVVREQEVPPTYVRDIAPMKNSTNDCFFTADKQRVVTYDCTTGESYVFHLGGLYAVTLLDAGTTANMNAGLVDGNKYISSHINGLCLWDLSKLNPNKNDKVSPDKVHKLLKHRTKKDPGDLTVTPRLACNLGNKWTTAYKIPSGKSFVLKSDTDMYGVIPVGEDNAVQWSEKDVYYWTVSTETSVALKGHTRSINDVYVSDDKKLILSTSDDASVRLWDIATQASTVLKGVHQGAAKAKFLGRKPLTWGSAEVVVWEVENNAVKDKVVYRIPEWTDEDGIEDVLILTDNIIVVRGPSCMFFDLKQPAKPVEQYARVDKLYPLECKEGTRVVGCARNGTMTLMTCGTNDEGELEVSRDRLNGHTAQAEVKAIPQTSQFLSYGKDKKVMCWNVEAELLWSMTFGYSITSVHLQYDQVQARIQALLVHMDGGNFALFKPKDVVQADYKQAREEVKKADQAVDDELDALLKSLEPVPSVDDELDALLKSLNEPPPGEKSLDELLAELNALV